MARVLAIGEALSVAGWRIVLAARPGTVETVARAAALPVVPIRCAAIAEEPAALMSALPGGCDLLLVDHYGWTTGEEEAVHSWAKRVAVVGDFARPHASDVVVDPTPGRAGTAYCGIVPRSCVVLAGAAWAPLERRFGAARAAALAARGQRRPEHLLVAMGMTDAANATLRTIEGIRASRFEGCVDVVLGGSAPNRASVTAALPPRARLHLDPPDMPALIARADLAIGAGGVSALERACLGLPSLLIEVANNQREAIAGLVAAGAARPLGALETISPHRIADALESCLRDAPSLTAMSHAATRVCDGLGALRVAIALAPERSRDGAPVTLRPAGREDCNRLLAWQRSPGIRTHARNPVVPTPEEHAAWLERSLADPKRILSILAVGSEAAGMLRLDRRSDEARSCHEVSILIAPEYQRQGIGAAALRLARRLVPQDDLVAEILPKNDASRALFSAAGYEQCSDTIWQRHGGIP